MLGTILIIFWIICISIAIYIIKNYSFIKQKIEEKLILQGVFFSIIIILVIILLTLIIIYGIFALDNFEIIDASIFIKELK